MPQPTRPKTEPKEPATQAAAKPAPPEQEPQTAPPPGVIVYRKKKKKRRRRYTRGLRDFQQLGRGVVRASDRIADAVAAGLTDFRKRSNRSARRRRDGALRDALPNLSRAMGETLRRSADAPYDVTRRIYTNWVARQVRAVSRLVSSPLFR